MTNGVGIRVLDTASDLVLISSLLSSEKSGSGWTRFFYWENEKKCDRMPITR